MSEPYALAGNSGPSKRNLQNAKKDAIKAIALHAYSKRARGHFRQKKRL
jgi:hypothetical protein